MTLSRQEELIRAALKRRPRGENTVKWLAEKISANRSSLHRRMGHGELSNKEVERVAAILGIPVTDLRAAPSAVRESAGHYNAPDRLSVAVGALWAIRDAADATLRRIGDGEMRQSAQTPIESTGAIPLDQALGMGRGDQPHQARGRKKP